MSHRTSSPECEIARPLPSVIYWLENRLLLASHWESARVSQMTNHWLRVVSLILKFTQLDLFASQLENF